MKRKLKATMNPDGSMDVELDPETERMIHAITQNPESDTPGIAKITPENATGLLILESLTGVSAGELVDRYMRGWVVGVLSGGPAAPPLESLDEGGEEEETEF